MRLLRRRRRRRRRRVRRETDACGSGRSRLVKIH
jgi:hypothetical protein